MTAPTHRLQAAGEQQDGEQNQPGQGKAVNDRNRNGDFAQLQFQGDPGGTPDQDSEQVQGEVHGGSLGIRPCIAGAPCGQPVGAGLPAIEGAALARAISVLCGQ
ncbi:hypothetical protein D3C81_1804590 [compost metagenome]